MASTAPPKLQEPSALRSVISLLIFIHLTCVMAVLFVPFEGSALQRRLVSIFSPYTQFFEFAPDNRPFFLTLGREPDDDHVIVVDLYRRGDQSVADQPLVTTIVLPDRGSRWLGDRQRYFAIADVLAYSARSEADPEAGEIARSIGRRLMDENGLKRAVVRVVQRMAQPLDPAALLPGFPPDRPTDPRYDVLLYEADVFYDEDGAVQVNKRAGRAEVAPRQRTSSPQAPR